MFCLRLQNRSCKPDKKGDSNTQRPKNKSEISITCMVLEGKNGSSWKSQTWKFSVPIRRPVIWFIIARLVRGPEKCITGLKPGYHRSSSQIVRARPNCIITSSGKSCIRGRLRTNTLKWRTAERLFQVLAGWPASPHNFRLWFTIVIDLFQIFKVPFGQLLYGPCLQQAPAIRWRIQVTEFAKLGASPDLDIPVESIQYLEHYTALHLNILKKHLPAGLNRRSNTKKTASNILATVKHIQGTSLIII